jgi:hypothetical protein
MPLALTKIFSNNDIARDNYLGGDLTTAVFRLVGADPYPGAAGEPVTFAADFIEVYSVSFGFNTAAAALHLVPVFVPGGNPNLGAIHFFEVGAAGPLAEIAGAAYPVAIDMRVIVVGRPATEV